MKFINNLATHASAPPLSHYSAVLSNAAVSAGLKELGDWKYEVIGACRCGFRGFDSQEYVQYSVATRISAQCICTNKLFHIYSPWT